MRWMVLVLLLAALSDAQPCNPAVIAIGDSRTGDRGDGQTNWPAQVTKVYVANYAVPGYVWSQCVTAYATALSQLVPQHGSTVVQCGVNDIINLADNGHSLFNTEKAWIEANATASNRIYWQNMPGFKAAYPTQSLLDARNAYNSDLAAYCLNPAPYVKCQDIATLLWDPADHDKLLASYTLDGIHYTTAGHAVIASTFSAGFP